MFSAIVGCIVRVAFRDAVPQLLWLSSALGMSIALAVMQVTRTVHPPGGCGCGGSGAGPWCWVRVTPVLLTRSVAGDLMGT